MTDYIDKIGHFLLFSNSFSIKSFYDKKRLFESNLLLFINNLLRLICKFKLLGK